MDKQSTTKGIILAIDDTKGNLRVLLETLSAAGHEVLIASDGETGISTAQYAKPELILLDVMMPGISGYETCKRLKKNPETAHIPIIFMTALHETEEKVKAFQLGAVDFVTKPFAEAELLARVNTHLTVSRLQNDLTRRNAQLEDLNRLKNEFLGMAAHDIRNPLSTIVATADLVELMVQQPTPSADLPNYITNISTAAVRISAIINNLLDVNAIETGERRLNEKILDLVPIVQQSVQQNQLNAQKKDIAIQFHSTTPRATASLDDDSVCQVIDNILSNAVKYSPSGSTVSVSVGEIESVVRLEISDQGPGLSEEDLSKMFRKFCRLAPKPTGGEPSTGLGLWIVKQLTESMNGTIRCESTLGEGCQFIAEWPQKSAEAKDAA